MERHVANAQVVGEALKAHPAVAWISYPGLPDHPDHRLAQRLFPKGPGSMIAFGIKGGRDAGRRFIEALRLASHLANVGDAKTLVVSASTTHSQMNAEELTAAGVGEDLVRLSVGLEAAADIIEDLTQALRASQKS